MAESGDILVIGAGPAGLAAAAAASAHGARVTLLDAQPRAGGQVWRHDIAHRPATRTRRALQAIAAVKQRFAARVVDADISRHTLLVESQGKPCKLHWDRLILATGARELFLPFPGWTLPGVTGAGGLQALVKQGWPIAGKRVVVAGSGPLLLAAAASLRQHGARVLAIVEQAERKQVYAFARQLWRWPGKLVQAIQLRRALAGIPIRYDSVVTSAHGEDHLPKASSKIPPREARFPPFAKGGMGGFTSSSTNRHDILSASLSVTVESGDKLDEIACDYLAVGYGLVPNVTLARLLGCALTGAVHSAIRVGALQETSIEGVFAAGECCGIGGMQTACIEGSVAGHAAAGNWAAAGALRAQRDRARGFSQALAKAFAPRPRTHALADAGTIVCRCEDVTWGELQSFADARSAKLATRCGMGACQGRICGAALAELKGWSWHGHPRAPLFPTPLATLAEVDTSRADTAQV